MLVRGMSVAFKIMRGVLNRTRHVLGILAGSLLAAALLFSIFEGKSFMDGLWWAVITGWTVGYGDLYPETIPRRILCMVYIFWFSLLWLIVAAHILAATLIDRNAFTNEEQETIKASLLEILQAMNLVQANRTTLPTAKEWAANGHYTPNNEDVGEQEESAFGIVGENADTE